MAKRGRPALPVEERLHLSTVKQPNGCWEFIGATNPSGYAYISDAGKRIGVHRLAYQLAKGPIPKTLVVRHSCDNRRCVNPDHLLLGSHTQNVLDRVSRGRSAVGEAHGRSVLMAAQVMEIRARYATGEVSQEQLANEYQVNRNTIRSIIKGATWGHLPQVEPAYKVIPRVVHAVPEGYDR